MMAILKVVNSSLGGMTHDPQTKSENGSVENTMEEKPLYWVAPMDANYKRDKPGKSPMGMDLIPVYAEDSSSNESGPGAIKISPEVVNNLGVRTSLVVKKALQAEINTVGYVQYDENLLVHIHPRVEGWIEKLYLKAEGDPVKKGQPLYEIYSPALVNAQEELLLAIERKNRRLIRAAEERLAALQIPSSVIERLRKNRQVLQHITFFAPQNGVVDNLNIRQGFFVKPGTTLMSIGALEQVWVEAEIFERQAPLVKTGTPVTMSLDYLPGQDWHGKVDYIYPTLDATTRTVKVRLRFENRNNLLKPNMFAQVTIHAQSETETVVVPKEAVIRTGSQDRVVLALENGRFKSIAVKIGIQDQRHMEILSGVKAGEKVVTSAQFLIDSESSKSSDFKRMQPMNSDEQTMVMSATVDGKINTIDVEKRVVNISRGPIEKWGRAATTMDFSVDNSIDLSQLSENAVVRFTFEIRDGSFIIIELDKTTSQNESYEENHSARNSSKHSFHKYFSGLNKVQSVEHDVTKEFSS
ncbi:efflux RND transporter periplasmic adaptor subunit [Aliikangiella coralliicola]|uniref:Efflux RND transporter periplasmic adaptor subunit n=2 Tax=Aliikangiella coralliicola TaxID=2592383 RepID=A0A545U817_9GAMM|nr:efflux RND transporter periplasmic adaptor subunit [Aliikangiella coralliicola]